MDECETDQISQSKNKATKKRYGVQFSIFDSYTTAEINMLLKAIDMLEEIVNDKKEELNKQLEEEKSKTLFKDLMDLDNVTSAGNLIIDSEV
jgi:transcription elongation factor Elf1